MRHLRAWRLIIVGVAFVATAAVAAMESGKAPSVHRLGLIVDPTVFQSSESAKFDELRSSLGHLLESPRSIPEGTEVVVWIVGPESLANAGPDLRKEFTFAANAPASSHMKNVKNWFDNTLSVRLDKSWQSAHEKGSGTTARSCILTSLYRAATYFTERPDSKNTNLIILSDFLEVCNEWGAFVNLEQQPFATVGTSLKKAQELIQFKNTNSIMGVLIPSKQTQTPMRQNDLKKTWVEVFRRLASASRIEVVTSIPDQLLLVD